MTKKTNEILVAVAGQPNSGKSTIFNCLTGASQHVANYPGITVEKKIGTYRVKEDKIILVDLPGTYSLTSYTQEERVARDFLLLEKPEVVVDVVDASNLERNLYLVFQLIEMNVPLVVCLNMMDVAKRRGFDIDTDKLSRELGVPVVPTIGNKGKGKKELKETVWSTYKNKTDKIDSGVTPIRIDYGKGLEPILAALEQKLSEEPRLTEHYSPRWLAVKLMENDSEARRLVRQQSDERKNILDFVAIERDKFISLHNEAPEKIIAYKRYQTAEGIVERCLSQKTKGRKTWTDRIDQLVCHRVAGPLILAIVFYLFYKITMSPDYGGQKLASLAWPYLAKFRDLMTYIPLSGLPRSLFLNGIVDGVLAIANYIPIFFVLFILIAILEDTGYMTRIAFHMDRVLRAFGLHGQSTLPMMLSGVVVGGCAVVGTMSTRGIKDPRARLATILILPLLNCMAKIPFYILMTSIFFKKYQAEVLGFMSVITLILVLVIAKIFTLTILKKEEEVPFVLEMPAYHLPTVRGVLMRTYERLMVFIKKVGTIIVAVAVIVWCGITFPGISKERAVHYNSKINKATQGFMVKLGKDNPYKKLLAGEGLNEFEEYWSGYKKSKMGLDEEAQQALNEKFMGKNSQFFKIANKGKYIEDGKIKRDKYAKKAYTAYRKLYKTIERLHVTRRKETVKVSYAGRLGQSLVPLTKWAGMDWKINVAMISSFAAKENLVATLGSIYSMEKTEAVSRESLAVTMKKETSCTGWTPLHAIAIMLFVAIFPPCLMTLIMVRIETGSNLWTLFVAIYPIILGFLIAVVVFQGGRLLGFGG
ncbi:ferrous iron transport protein B [bacterium]|nr:ferrous iron transport protein B [bacterium]